MSFFEELSRRLKGLFRGATAPEAAPDGDAAGYAKGVEHAAEHGDSAPQLFAEVVASQFGTRHNSPEFNSLTAAQKDRYAAAWVWLTVFAARCNGPAPKYRTAAERGVDLLIERWPSAERALFQGFLAECFANLDPLVRNHPDAPNKVFPGVLKWILGPESEGMNVFLLLGITAHFIWMRGYARGCLSKFT